MNDRPPTPLVGSDAHLAHAGLVELLAGREVPCYESPERATAIRDALLATGEYALVAPEAHGPDPIAAVHELELIDLVEHAWTDAVADGHDPARCLIPDTFLLRGYAGRMPLDQLPRGRHDRLGAYCFDTATPIAAQWLRDRGAARVAILDIDFHHGNGTQQIFWERGDVLYVSLHGDPRGIYPYYSGYATERGAGDGEGATLNLPLPAGTEGDAYLGALDEGLGVIGDFDPDAPLIVSLGFDTYHADPICNLALRTEDYGRIGGRIASLGRPVVALQEGGYAVEALGANAVAILGALRRGLAG